MCGPQVRLNPKYAAEHQLAVIDCLEDPDPTLKKKTLELLFKMAKPNNVEVRAAERLIVKQQAGAAGTVGPSVQESPPLQCPEPPGGSRSRACVFMCPPCCAVPVTHGGIRPLTLAPQPLDRR